MSVGTSFFDSAAADYVKLGDVRIPVPALMTSPPVQVYKWDQRGGVGLQGAWSFYNGYDLMEFTLQFQMWSAETIDDFDTYADPFGPEQTFKTKFKYKGGKIIGVESMDITYPAVNQIGIKAVVVRSIGAIMHQGKGHYTCDVVFGQFSPPPPVKASKLSGGPLRQEQDVPPKNAVQTQVDIARADIERANAEQARLDAAS
jgi:hypothetical protein